MEKAVFLDRDGVINKRAPEHDYIKSISNVNIFPGAIEAVRRFNANNFKVIVITNQAGVARGLMSADTVNQINNYIHGEFNKKGARIDSFFACMHGYDDNCDCRKPKPGLVLQGAKKWNVDLRKSWLVGDSNSDIQAGLSAGIPEKQLILIPSDDDLLKYAVPILED